ncbi:MAG TPA: DUF4838 domain-containing protein, partial [Phycisphaeraceae bacterium]
DHEARTAIVIPDSPLRVEQYAAQELQHHIEKASGARLQIVREADQPDTYPGLIYVGNTQAARQAGINTAALEGNAFIIRLVGNRLFLAGQDNSADPLEVTARTGTLFAVYEFLEQQLGVRWLWPGELGEFVPPSADIRVQSWDQVQSPHLAWTDWRNTPTILRPDLWPDPKQGDDFIRAQAQWKKRLRFAGTHDIRAKHSFESYWQQFHRDHPDYFNLLPDGTRRPLEGDATGSTVTMCLANPAFQDRVIQEWDKNGRPPVIKVGENDSPGMCTCDLCRAWDAPDKRFQTSAYWGHGRIPNRRARFTDADLGLAGGSASWDGHFAPENAPSLSDRYARFYLTIQEKAGQLRPDVLVSGFAYANYWHAPVQTQLNDQILISFVPPLWYPYTPRMSQQMRQHWDGWRATGARMMLRPNLTHAGHAFPIWYVQPMVDDFKYVIETGSVAMDFDSLTGSWATQGPTLYALARVIHRPDLSAQQILDEYFGAFGPATSAVRAYFEHWEAVSRSLTEDDINRCYIKTAGGGSFHNWVMIADLIFTPPVMAKGERLIEQAAQAAGNDPTAAARVEFLAKGFHHAQLNLNALRAFKAYQAGNTPARQAALTQAAKRLHDYRVSIQGDYVAAIGYLISREPAPWRQLAR